ncbi:(-)-germacrene D synthase-like [Phalaenopsis equestris]|uniref:(-)-germacrene D synthase-like n=1 Tax=Phalaenopsis equestris TaxID=78828 RepID=UPI0009E42113|nr:(-)-germacrene D synthase-like [Phalaenopsis equestris]
MEDDGIVRQSANYTPSVWGDYFIKHSAPFSSSIEKTEEWISERVEQLVGLVKNLLESTDYSKDEFDILQLIDALQRLGISYHFEEQIDKKLRDIYDHNYGESHEINLQAAALKFRLLRQHGYRVTSDVFRKYKDEEGEFRSDLADDVRGLLSLYEACFMATHEDDILNEALSFTEHHLQRLSLEKEDLQHESPALKKLISQALELPLHRRIPRLGARYYIDAYEHDKEQRNDTILELAKLDFHLLQLLHYEEARSLSIWWKGIGCSEIFKFSRDRIVECYFWILSVYFEPQYSKARKITTKVIALLSITDDIYDAYGTSDELQSFTNVIQRWDMEAAEQLKEYLKIQFHNLNRAFQEFEDELSSNGKSYRVHYLKEILKVVVRAWNMEVKWRNEGYIPALKEHLQVTTVTTCYNLLTCASLIGMGDEVTIEAFDWISSFPEFTYQASLICRLRDDVVSQEFEQKRNHVASAVQCYMNEHNSTLDDSCKMLLKLVESSWKSLNHEYLSLSKTFTKAVLMRVINLARVMETAYDVHDKYTHSALIKDQISLLLIEPLSF